MQSGKRTTLAILSLIATLALLVVACAAQPESTATKAPAAATPTKAPSTGAATPATAPTGPTATPAPQIKTGGTLKLAIDFEQTNLDPHIDTSGAISPITYNKLIRHNLENKLVGDTAEKWEVSPDGKSVTFTLKKGVKFWNVPPVNGREMTCDDWAYSLKRIGNPGAEFQGKDLVSGITDTQCIDKYTLKIVTDPPFAPLLNNLTRHYTMAVVPKELVDQQGDLREKFIGTGPFMIKEWVKGQATRYVKNPDYFEKGVPYLDGIDSLLMPDKAARIAALRTKQVDHVATRLTPKDKEALEKTNPEIFWIRTPGGLDSIRLNATKPPFNNEKVRYAINLAIDRKKLIQLGLFGSGRISGLIEPSWGDLGLPNDQLLALPGFRYPKDQDIAEAKKLLAEAGYPNGFKTTSVNWELMWDYAAPVKDELAKIGIEVDMQNIPLAVWKPKQLNKDYEMSMGNATLRADIDTNLYGQFHPKGGFNESGLDIPELNTLLEEQRRILDPAKRAKLAQELELKLQKVGSWIAIAQRLDDVAFQSYVKGIKPGDAAIPRYFVHSYMPYLWLDK